MPDITWHGDQLVALIQQRVVAVMQKCGFQIVPMVQAVTPVKTGAARASVRFIVHEEEKRIVLQYGGTVNYYIWIEVGTRGRPGRAPLAQTFDQAVALVRRELAATGLDRI